VTAVDPLSSDAMAAMERRLVSVVRSSPTRTLRYQQVVAAYAAAGGSPGTAHVQLSRSAAIERLERGVYAARGDATARRASSP